LAPSAAILPRLDIPTPLIFVDADALPSFCEMAASSALQRVIVVTE
jgi:hypothetical protein